MALDAEGQAMLARLVAAAERIQAAVERLVELEEKRQQSAQGKAGKR